LAQSCDAGVIDLMLALPIEELDAISLHHHVRHIGTQ
jgi:hypothetical protein